MMLHGRGRSLAIVVLILFSGPALAGDRNLLGLGIYSLGFDDTGLSSHGDESSAQLLKLGRHNDGFSYSFEYLNLPAQSFSYSYQIPFASKTDQRKLDLVGFGASAYSEMWNVGVASIYAGANITMMQFEDSNQNGIQTQRTQSSSITYLTPLMGISFSPESTFSLYLEARYLLSVDGALEYQQVKGVDGFGRAEFDNSTLDVNMMLIGGGLQWNF